MFPVKSCFCSAAWYKYRAHIESERQVEKEEASGNKWKALEDEVDSFKKQKKSMQLRKTKWQYNLERPGLFVSNRVGALVWAHY